MNLKPYLQSTSLLDFDHQSIQTLSYKMNWQSLPLFERIGAIYDFVQNAIIFGYNESDEIPASKVLEDGYGQCNTKATLLMALFRMHNIPCRFHGFTIDKSLQKGAVMGISYLLAPRNIIHSWVEIYYEDRWIDLEGFIIDKAYLRQIQSRFPSNKKNFCGYGIATDLFLDPPIEWKGDNTYIQKEGINHDFGVFDSPDKFYQKHGSNLAGIKRFIFKTLIRKRMNANVNRIRDGKIKTNTNLKTVTEVQTEA